MPQDGTSCPGVKTFSRPDRAHRSRELQNNLIWPDGIFADHRYLVFGKKLFTDCSLSSDQANPSSSPGLVSGLVPDEVFADHNSAPSARGHRDNESRPVPSISRS
jgi:hypothetical protein